MQPALPLNTLNRHHQFQDAFNRRHRRVASRLAPTGAGTPNHPQNVRDVLKLQQERRLLRPIGFGLKRLPPVLPMRRDYPGLTLSRSRAGTTPAVKLALLALTVFIGRPTALKTGAFGAGSAPRASDFPRTADVGFGVT